MVTYGDQPNSADRDGQDSNELWSTFASGVDGRLRIEKSTTSLAGWVATKNEMVNIPDAEVSQIVWGD